MNRKIVLNRMRRNHFFMIGIVGVCVILILIILGPVLTHYDPITNTLLDRFIAPEGFSKGFSGHLFGTDQLGRDVFSRLLYGGRYSLMIAAIVVVFQVLIGTVLGVCAGFFGGMVDAIIMRRCEVFRAIPPRIMAVADVFDAISQKRCYRDAMPLDKCFQIIAEGSGKDFDPEVVNAFFAVREEAERICMEYREK